MHFRSLLPVEIVRRFLIFATFLFRTCLPCSARVRCSGRHGRADADDVSPDPISWPIRIHESASSFFAHSTQLSTRARHNTGASHPPQRHGVLRPPHHGANDTPQRRAPSPPRADRRAKVPAPGELISTFCPSNSSLTSEEEGRARAPRSRYVPAQSMLCSPAAESRRHC
jgi:hypothetical protein